MSVNHFVKKDDLHYNIIAQICRAENFDRSDITLRKASSSMVPLLTAAEAVIKLTHQAPNLGTGISTRAFKNGSLYVFLCKYDKYVHSVYVYVKLNNVYIYV